MNFFKMSVYNYNNIKLHYLQITWNEKAKAKLDRTQNILKVGYRLKQILYNI